MIEATSLFAWLVVGTLVTSTFVSHVQAAGTGELAAHEARLTDELNLLREAHGRAALSGDRELTDYVRTTNAKGLLEPGTRDVPPCGQMKGILVGAPDGASFTAALASPANSYAVGAILDPAYSAVAVTERESRSGGVGYPVYYVALCGERPA
jgi:hypothetical protein